jgi:predicted transcriptional regulator
MFNPSPQADEGVAKSASEARLSQIASHAGTDTERLVKDAALRLLEQDARFRAAVREGIAQADREEFIEEEEMDARIERMLNS